MPSAAACCFSVYAICHSILAAMQFHYGGIHEPGSAIVFLIALALVFDNGIIALGRVLFPDAASPRSLILPLSQIRFYAHAVLTPLLAVQASSIGRRAGVPWLMGEGFWIWLFFGLLAFFGTAHHARHAKLVLKQPHPKEPKGSWMRQIVQATLADSSPTTIAFMVGPAVLVCIFTMIVGVSMRSQEAKGAVAAGDCLWIAALIELLSNAGPPWVMQLTGNAGEVVLLGGFVAAARLISL